MPAPKLLYIGIAFIFAYILMCVIFEGFVLQISGEELLGKSRAKITKILFEKSERTKAGEVRIGIINPNNSITSYYFSDPLEVKCNANVINSPMWLCFFGKNFFTLEGKMTCYRIKFENDKAIFVELKSYNDSM